MKRLAFITLFSYAIVFASCGQLQINNGTPLLIRTSPETQLPRIEVKVPCVYDTTKIIVSVIVRFNENLGDSTKLTTPTEVYVSGFRVLNKQEINNTPENSVEIVFEEFPDSEEEIKQTETEKLKPLSQQESCIINACNKQFRLWLKDQPYSEMDGIENFYGQNVIALGYHVFLIPETILL